MRDETIITPRAFLSLYLSTFKPRPYVTCQNNQEQYIKCHFSHVLECDDASSIKLVLGS